MKKNTSFIKKYKTKFIVLVLLIAILIIIKVFVTAQDIRNIYKENLGIDIPNPEKSIYIINVLSIDEMSLQVMHYSEEHIKELKTKKFFRKIGENQEEFDRKYVALVKTNFMEGLTSKEQEKFNNALNEDVISNKDNYFALFEENKQGYDFTFLILDTKKDLMYSIISSC